MKKIVYTAALLFAVLLAACNFSAGVKHDLNTGLTVKNSGLRYKDYALTYNGVAANSDEWGQGESMKLIFAGVQGFKAEKGLVYPGISFTIKDLQGHVVDHEDDLLAEQARKGITPELASVLSAAYTLGVNFTEGKEYELEVHIFDKKGEGSVTAKMKFKVLPLKQPDLKVNVYGLSYDHIYFKGRNGRKENEALVGGRIGVILEGVKGFTEENGKVFPGGEVIIYGDDGKEKFHSEDLFKDKGDGADVEKTAGQISLTLKLEDEKLMGDHGKWVFRIWDKKSKAALEAEIMLTLR